VGPFQLTDELHIFVWNDPQDAETESVLDAWARAPGGESCDFSLLEKVGAWDLVVGLTEWDPERRMTLAEALEHPALMKPR
jgi:hypothetical protein|tara:strand:+ start:266 stop:508 length:243 start_codon:yes stop_codon:yes gene_type:complete